MARTACWGQSRTGLSIAIAIGISACSGSRSTSEPATRPESESEPEPVPVPVREPVPSPIAWLLWHDIQTLEGGRALYVEADGTALARIVEPPPDEQRHRGTLDAAHMHELARRLAAADFLHMTVPDRPGIPDEARAVFIVRFASGEERRVEKWAGVRHAGFDDLNRLGRQLTEELRQHGRHDRLPFDAMFHPPGPWPNPFAQR